MFGVSIGWSWRKIFFGLIVLGAIGAIIFVPQVRSRVLFFLDRAGDEMNVSTDRSQKMGGSRKVYVASGSKYYHATRNCARLKGKRAVPRALDEAHITASPCPECKPPR
jgi:hypothetical protein